MYKIIIWMFENWLNADHVKAYIIEKAINLPLEGKIKSFITEKYKKIATAKLPLKTEVVKVKKGKARYKIVFFATKTGSLKFNFGRHLNNKFIECALTE